MDEVNKRKIGAVILAAGLSKRMKQPKQFLLLNGVPLFMHVVHLAMECGLDPIILVVGNNEEVFAKYLTDYSKVFIVKNKDFQEGMGTSLRVGVQSLKEQAGSAFIFLGDQPFVTKRVIEEIISKYHQLGALSQNAIIRPQYKEIESHPILFDSSLFPEFNQLFGDRGGKCIIEKYRDHLHIINFDQHIYGLDIDTPDDYLVAKRWSSSS